MLGAGFLFRYEAARFPPTEARPTLIGVMPGIAFDALLETGILIDVLPLREGEFDGSIAFRNPALIDAIRYEGRRL